MQTLDTEVEDDIRQAVIRRNWHLIVASYTSAELSHGEDKLRAIAGASSVLKSQFGLRASFGMWIEYFLTELLWKSVTPYGKLLVESRAPSWSWAKLDKACIINDYVCHLPYDISPEYPGLNDSWKQIKMKAQLLSGPPEVAFSRDLINITNMQPFKIKLRGPLQVVDWHFRGTKVGLDSYFVTVPTTHRVGGPSEMADYPKHEHWNFKADYDVPSGLNVACLIVTEKISDSVMIPDEQLGLVLTKLEGSGARYKRVGLYRHRFDATWEGCRIFTDKTPIEEVEIV